MPWSSTEKLAAYSKKWKKTPAGKASAARYRQTTANKEIQARFRKSEAGKACQKRYAQKPNVRLRIALRKRLNMAIKNGLKGGSAVRDLGCTIPEFRLYMEALWGPGMTWANWGKGPETWQIDHRRPLASFDLSKREQVQEACLFINLQPLWWEDHVRKSAEDLRCRSI